MRLLSIAVAFVAALAALSAGWAAVQAAWAAPTPGALARVAGYALVFAAAFLYLGFWVYAADRAAGRVRRRIGLYERFLAGR
ncbi:MAG: hypothetical protein QN173_05755 [Armatimonadota bacterium]|nr:hypothetical protein [Armatimonadota bacterium]MDR7437564.1 hypothetical protein [Armatimonadota bacterium]MDR7472158.1 hypothetical protein [Armatimonadota bacterium]MDR7507097.1 hypothetical protein [Armatimonadota bacterium]MDR7508728.1 hypothetical protein [Armatimonadota bacterium]